MPVGVIEPAARHAPADRCPLWSALRADHAGPQPQWVDAGARFAFALPAGWRQLTPDEGRQLERDAVVMPAEIERPEPPNHLVFGPVERWLAGSFDGRTLSVDEIEGEPEVGPSGIAGIAAHWAQQPGEGVVIERLEVGSVGSPPHPALLGRFRVGAGPAAAARFEAYVPAGGRTYRFALAWPFADAPAGEAAFAQLSSSIAMASKPRGPTTLGSKLLWAGALGLLAGVALHVLRRARS